MNQESARQRFLVSRITAALIAVPLTAFTVLVVRATIESGKLSLWENPLALGLIAASALSCGFALRGDGAKSRVMMNSALVGAIVVGGIALVLGFFGPLILTPKSNLGPLLGIFTTGPLGFAIGA